MDKKVLEAIEELEKRLQGLTDEDEIAECIADYKAEIKEEKKDLNKLRWEEIARLMEDPDKKKLFKLGSIKEEELYTGEKVKVKLISLNPHDITTEDKKANAAFMFFIDGEYEMNEKATNEGGWEKSKMRNEYMQRFFKLLPEPLQKVIKTVKKTTAGQITDDKLFLLSESEATGDNEYSYSGEGEQYEYFKNNDKPEQWNWLRSPYVSSGNSFCDWSNYGYVYSYSASTTLRVALCFCI